MTSRPADGPAGERWASALLTTALCGQTIAGSAVEDDNKIDLKVTFEHAFREKVRIVAHCQVRSGSSYLGSANLHAFHLKNIEPETISTLRKGTRPSLLIWVPPPQRKAA